MISEGTDVATILSMVGGPKSGSNLKNIKIYREFKDSAGNTVYTIDLKKFIEKGDKSDFIEILPNDTIVVPQTTSSYILESAGYLNTLLNVLSLFLLVNSSL
jgi:hypothetical protein